MVTTQNFRPVLSDEDQDQWAANLLQFVRRFPAQTCFQADTPSCRVLVELGGLQDSVSRKRPPMVRKKAVRRFQNAVRQLLHMVTEKRRKAVRDALVVRCHELLGDGS